MTNCANIIRKDIVLIDLHGNQISSAELNNRRVFFKNKIYQLLQGDTVGRTVFFEDNDFSFMIPALAALWELGCNVFVHESNSLLSNVPEFKNFWNGIDLVIKKKDFPGLSGVPIIIILRDYQAGIQYQEISYTLNQNIDGKTVAVKTHSSGTMGFPKIIEYDHEHILYLVNRQIEWQKLNQDMRPLHFKTMHHGALFIHYALPLLKVCDKHWWMQPSMLLGDQYNAKNYFNLLLPAMKQQGINRVLVPYDWLDQINQAAPVDFGGNLEIMTVRPYSKNTAQYIFTNINPGAVITDFGCSEVGTMFVNRCTAENWKNYEPGVFEWIADDILLEIEIDHVLVKRQHRPWYKISDRMQKVDHGIRFLGRSWSLNLPTGTVYLTELQKFLEQHWQSNSFQLVPDSSNNKIFLAVFDKNIKDDLDQLNQQLISELGQGYQITELKYFDMSTVYQGIKPSLPLLLYSFLNPTREQD